MTSEVMLLNIYDIEIEKYHFLNLFFFFFVQISHGMSEVHLELIVWLVIQTHFFFAREHFAV